MRRVYLDNAATSWPKCGQAVEAASEFIRECGAASGRGAYRSAQEADRWLQRSRFALSRLIGASAPETVVFCNSGTHALNAGLLGVLRPGQRVITTAAEHNSVLRPLQRLAKTLPLRVSIVPCDRAGRADLQAAQRLAADGCDWIIVGHASNVTGAVQDLHSWADLARAAGAKLFVDAAQTIGYVPVDVARIGIDVLAAAGHKGLRGLLGTGFLYVAPEMHEGFRAAMWGGTGMASDSDDVEDGWPTAVEVGNLNLPGIISMGVAAEVLLQTGGCQQWQGTFGRLLDGLNEIAGLEIIGDRDWSPQDDARVPVVSISTTGWSVHDLAAILDSHYGIETRAGFHCAARVHACLGTESSGGTLRLSPSESTPVDDVDYALDAMRQIVGVQSAG